MPTMPDDLYSNARVEAMEAELAEVKKERDELREALGAMWNCACTSCHKAAHNAEADSDPCDRGRLVAKLKGEGEA